MTAAQVSERCACRYTAFSRSTHRYQSRRDDRELRARLETLAMLKPRWGYRRLHWLLVRDGWPVNRKRVQRVYREAGLHVRRRRRKRVSVARVPRGPLFAPNDRWSMDFVHDTLGDGRVIRVLTVVDDFTRTCPLIAVDFALPAAHVIQLLDERAHDVASARARLRQRLRVHEPGL
jgi:putative transposase